MRVVGRYWRERELSKKIVVSLVVKAGKVQQVGCLGRVNFHEVGRASELMNWECKWVAREDEGLPEGCGDRR